MDLTCKHTVLDLSQGWELMSWSRSRDSVFTVFSGSHIKGGVVTSSAGASLLCFCVGLIQAWTQHVKSAVIRELFREGSLFSDYSSRTSRTPAQSSLRDERRRVCSHVCILYTASFPWQFTSRQLLTLEQYRAARSQPPTEFRDKGAPVWIHCEESDNMWWLYSLNC